MIELIDVNFDFNTETPPGLDPDAVSPTLKRYHQILWSKRLPSSAVFTLAPERASYLVHRSDVGTHHVTSDAITTNLLGRASKVIAILDGDQRPTPARYTIGSSIVFPGDRRRGKATINGARGLHPRIADRFDLTLECIRRHYENLSSPLSETLGRYSDFFDLFVDFKGYVDFFLLHDLVDNDIRMIRFLHEFDDFNTPAVPQTPAGYLAYVKASTRFIRDRNSRIDRWVREQAPRIARQRR